MQQYHYEDVYRGKRRTLVIFRPEEGNEYRVFCDGGFIGIIACLADEDTRMSWKTDYSILKPVVLQIGKFIELEVKTAP